jgi:hypothetical protein
MTEGEKKRLRKKYEQVRQANVQARREYWDEQYKVRTDPTRGTKTLDSLGHDLKRIHGDLIHIGRDLDVSPDQIADLTPLPD